MSDHINTKSFWGKLEKPFFILAPMADVTDWPFRQVVIECGKPDIFFTEFTSCDGLCSKGRDKLLKNLYFTENERPIVAQFFGSKPDNFYKCAQLAVELGFDGIDINMGCPDRKVLKQGGGAALIQKPESAKEIIQVTKEGANGLPVSVKTRIGYNKIETEEWISNLIEAGPAAITVHGRTKKEMSLVPAHWAEIGKAAKIIKSAGVIAIGNGDVGSYKEGVQKTEEYNLDGIMVGRGVFSNPWFFNLEINLAAITPEQKINLLLKHMRLFTEFWGNPSPGSGQGKNFATMKRFFKIYVNGWAGAKELRSRLMDAKNIDLCYNILRGGLYENNQRSQRRFV